MTPIRLIGVGEVLSREKLCPVLGLFVARSHAQALMQARGLLRYAGAGHSAAVHSTDEQAVVRADPGRGDKGGDAARAALELAAVLDRVG